MLYDFTAVGDVVNTASRLQGEAAGGEVAYPSEWLTICRRRLEVGVSWTSRARAIRRSPTGCEFERPPAANENISCVDVCPTEFWVSTRRSHIDPSPDATQRRGLSRFGTVVFPGHGCPDAPPPRRVPFRA